MAFRVIALFRRQRDRQRTHSNRLFFNRYSENILANYRRVYVMYGQRSHRFSILFIRLTAFVLFKEYSFQFTHSLFLYIQCTEPFIQWLNAFLDTMLSIAVHNISNKITLEPHSHTFGALHTPSMHAYDPPLTRRPFTIKNSNFTLYIQTEE